MGKNIVKKKRGMHKNLKTIKEEGELSRRAHHRPPIGMPRKHPVSVSFKPPKDVNKQNDLIDECLEWIKENPDIKEIDDFAVYKMISPYRFKQVAKENDYFSLGLDVAKSIIAGRLKKDVRNKSLDKEYLFRLLPLYSQDYHDLVNERWSEARRLKDSGSSNTVVQYIAVPLIPESPMVPPLKDGNGRKEESKQERDVIPTSDILIPDDNKFD